jgi:hypothetical protein
MCIPTYIHAYIHTCVRAYIHTFLHTYIHIHTYVHTHTHTYIRMCIPTYIHTFLHTYIRTYVHSYVHIHTYIHTCIHMRWEVSGGDRGLFERTTVRLHTYREIKLNKIVPSLKTKLKAMKMFWKVEVYLHAFLTLAHGMSGQPQAPSTFTAPRERVLTTNWTESSVDPRAGLDAVSKRKTSAPPGNRTPIVQRVASDYTDWAIPAERLRKTTGTSVRLALHESPRCVQKMWEFLSLCWYSAFALRNCFFVPEVT